MKIDGNCDSYVEELLKKARSSDFATANAAAEGITKMQKTLAGALSNKQAFELILNICIASNYGSFVARSLVSDKFQSIEPIKNLAVDFVNNNVNDAEKILSESTFAVSDLSVFENTYLI